MPEPETAPDCAAHSPLHAADDVTEAVVARIYDGMRDRTLPKREWTHAAHLVTAVCLLREAGLARAEAEMPGMIQRYNEATGTENSDTGGYHHTITLFYLRAIDWFLCELGPRSVVEACEAVLASAVGDRAYPLTAYTRERLFSVEARRGWVKPNLAGCSPSA